MAITRWDPFKDLISLRDKMNKLFEDSMSRSQAIDHDFSAGAWRPSVDIYETADRMVLVADLPGINQDAIELKIENNILTIRGEREMDKEIKREDFHRIERAYGSFSRNFTLPASIDVEKIKAEHNNGILQVILPKKEETQAKKIKIELK
jgi:HSP20 family protein